MPKKIIMIGILLLLLVGGIAFFVMRGTGSEETTQEKAKKRIAQPVNVIPVAERPYMIIMPFADGRNVSIVVDSLKKDATEGEYELEYQAGTLLQGAFGALNVVSLPSSTKILLGSCSAGGACTYHEDVQGGSLLARFEGKEPYAVKSDWKYIDNIKKSNQVSSKDAKFQLDADGLKTNRYIIIYNSPGYPDGVEGEVVSSPYTLAVSASRVGKGTLTMRAESEGENLQIAGWSGSEWQYFDSKVDGKMVTAEVELNMDLFLVVNQ